MRILLALILFAPLSAYGAQIHFIACTSDTTNTPNISASFTPTAGRLGVVVATSSGTADEMLATSSVGGQTYSLVDNGVQTAYAGFPAVIAQTIQVFVADQVYTAVAQTVTIDDPVTNATGNNICIYELSGMSRVGQDAVLQVAAPDNDNGAGATPTSVFAGNVNTNNPTLQAVLVVHSGSGVDLAEAVGWTDTTSTIFHLTPSHAIEVWTRDSGFTSGTITGGGTFGDSGAATAVEFDASSASSAPAFSVSPTAAPAANGVTISGTITGTADVTVATVGVAPGDGTPTCTQIQAGQNDGGAAALATGSEIWVDSVSNSYTATGTNPIPVMDYHTCARNGVGDSAVVSLADEDRTPRSGYALTTITSVGGTGLCDLDAKFDPDCAIGDVFELKTDSNQTADCDGSIEADGDFVLTPASGGACDGKRTFSYCPEDASSATTGLFTAPSCTFATDDLICNGNTAPNAIGDVDDAIVLLVEDVAMTARDLNSLFDDGDADSLTYTETGAGTLATGLTQNGTGNKDITGTPTTEDETGQALQWTATDECGDTDTFDQTWYVVNTSPTPDCVGNTLAECASEIVTADPWREFSVGLVISSMSCSLEPEGEILSQDPSASAERGPTDDLEVVIAQNCVAGKRRLGLGIGIGIP